MPELLSRWGEAAYAAAGFFWKAGWAFVMGYAISAMIQAFVPKRRLTRHMGGPDAKSVGLATLFGAASSSCSFAALAAARSLLHKGAHFVASVAFMFASTNLVVELGVLIYIFLGWRYLAAELVGGLVLIVVSSLLIRATFPRRWVEAARRKIAEESDEEEGDFDPWRKLRSAAGWREVGHHFVGEWKMVWREIAVGFTIAGFVKVFVPTSFWEAIFLSGFEGELPAFVLALENALVAPLVACLTFIGSMGNIPLAAVLAGSGVAFAGVMGFIYSDLMVPPLVKVNARYYGWRLALYVAGVMYASIVVTAMLLDGGFALLGLQPESFAGGRQAGESPFAVDYTFWLNLAFVAVAALLVWLARQEGGGHEHGVEDGGLDLQTWVTRAALALVAGGLIVHFI